MIVSLRGRLEDVNETAVVVDVGGIGYEVNVSGAVRRNLPALGQEVQIHTFLQVREDSMVLYGFASQEERSLFRQIITVAGIGPKTGLGILSALSPQQFVQAVEGQHLATLTSLPGIGKKTGERILLELKDKFKGVAWRSAASVPGPAVPGGILGDALEALIALGYAGNEAEQMVQNALLDLEENYDLQELLKVALANNARQRGERSWRRKG